MTRPKSMWPKLLSLTAFLLWSVVPVMAQREPSDKEQGGSQQKKVQSEPIVRVDIHHDVSPPLRDITPVLPDPDAIRQLEEFPNPTILRPKAKTPFKDRVRQMSIQPLVAGSVGLNFEGIGQGFPGFTLTGAPPDTNGYVGLTQYVQTVNPAFAVFDKNNGNLLLGARDFRTLFSGFGGLCETKSGSDPIVLYDKLANRWVLSVLVSQNQQNFECFAVSTTSDATGSYNRYAIPFGTILNDFPKLGVWPDAYYFAANQFDQTGGPSPGRNACAIDRNAALNGTPLRMVCFNVNRSLSGTLLPSDMDGKTRPPTGSPNFFFGLGTDGTSLAMFKFHVDFNTTSNSTFTGPTRIPVAAFTRLCPGGNCVPQSGTTQLLSSIGDTPNNRVAYRNLGDHETIVLNHSVQAGSVGGVRWYEIRNPNGPPTVSQQGTFAPDSNWRWMGSVATDGAGDIGAGYSISSSSIHPSIGVTGRAPSDPAGTLQSEIVAFAGGGSQTPTLSRWGDYAGITVDPVDDCTFWFTTEYIPTNGTFNWHTRIVNFKLNNCTAPVTNEAESLPVAAFSSGDVERVAIDSGYSGGRGVILEGNAVGDFVTFNVTIPSAKTYDIRVGLKNLNNRGIWQFSSNGVSHGAPVDQFSSTALFREVDIGPVSFGSAGIKAFKFTVTGKNPGSSSFWISIDYIKVIPQ